MPNTEIRNNSRYYITMGKAKKFFALCAGDDPQE